MHYRDIIQAPVISEKTHTDLESNKYTFRVAPKATKIDIQHAVEKIFKVDVEQVNVMNKRGKLKSMGRFTGRTSSWRKAVVTVKKGQKIAQFFEGM